MTKDEIIELVLNEYNVSKDQALSKSRNQNNVRPRRAIIYFFRTVLMMSSHDIKAYLNYNHHSTIVHHYQLACDFFTMPQDGEGKVLRRIERKIQYNEEMELIRTAYLDLESRIENLENTISKLKYV